MVIIKNFCYVIQEWHYDVMFNIHIILYYFCNDKYTNIDANIMFFELNKKDT